MNRRKRRVRIRSGAWGPAEPFIAADEELRVLDVALAAYGWTRPERVRFRVNVNGVITARLVWRRRREGLTQTHEVVLRAPVAPAPAIAQEGAAA